MQNFLGLLKLGKFEILGLFAKAFVACLICFVDKIRRSYSALLAKLNEQK
jgi:hypothetical protein